MAVQVVEQVSVVDAPVEQVWARVVTPDGINDEMRPWMTMSMPRGTVDLTIDDIEVGVPIGRAWIRLFGLLPIDYDHLSLIALDPGRAFHEKSTMLSMRSWEHERTLTPATEGRTTVHDRVAFEPRFLLRLSAGLFRRILAAFFAHRHRRLARHFG
jgi:ligand-binding SRPBCC domain-containing protein